MMDGMVRVTLEQPYFADSERVLCIRYGTTDAILPAAMQVDEYVADYTQPQPKIIPGKPINYHLRMTEGIADCENCGSVEVGPTVIMPVEAAKSYFGNWNVPRLVASGERVDVELTISHEKIRLAYKWGDYKKPMARRGQGTGAAYNVPKIGPPNVPHVVVQRLDSQGRIAPNTDWRPWEVFRWQDDCEPLTTEGLHADPVSSPGLITVSEDALKRMIAEAVAAERAAAKGGK